MFVMAILRFSFHQISELSMEKFLKIFFLISFFLIDFVHIEMDNLIKNRKAQCDNIKTRSSIDIQINLKIKMNHRSRFTN
jgi:hypothetical protein